MEEANLPLENAQEPKEGAYEPECDNSSSPPTETHERHKTITFAEFTEYSDNTMSQTSSAYKECLSQPAPDSSHRQRLQWLQKRRKPGLWAQCDDCLRWRYLPHVLDSHELPSKWYCRMNPDRAAADCTVPEASLRVREEEDLVHGEYAAGSVVWARLAGWPWWPAMVDDCPDTEQYYWLDGFSDIPTHYNVVFFDAFDASRAWIAPNHLIPYNANKSMAKQLLKNKRYKKRLEVAVAQADDADMLPLGNRLAKYSFISRYAGTIHRPKRCTKKELKKFQNQLKRKYNIDFPDESDSDSGEEAEGRIMTASKKRNVILPRTPKKPKEKNNRIPKEQQQETSTTNNILQDSEIVDSDTEIQKAVEARIEKAAPPNEIFKQHNSMAVQIGSTAPTIVNGSLDNDSSKTYVPDSESETESMTITVQDIETRVLSPKSDDFEF